MRSGALWARTISVEATFVTRLAIQRIILKITLSSVVEDVEYIYGDARDPQNKQTRSVMAGCQPTVVGLFTEDKNYVNGC